VPEGIVPELLIALALVAIIAAVVVTLRRRPPEGKGPSTRADVEAISRVKGVAVEVPRERDQPPPAPVVEAAPPTLRERLAKSRRFLSDRLADVLRRGPDAETWDDIEAVLIQADVGVEAATRITDDLRRKARERKVTDASDVRALLAEELVQIFPSDAERTLHLAPDGVTVWLVVGVNGTGKTTTIGKLARDLQERQRTVAMAAADEQLEVWAERSGADMVKHKPGADPGAVAFDAYQHARARAIDVLIVDTAGRLHTKTPLMDELAKVRRVIEKEGQVHEVLLVIDATAGQNGLVQAREFADSVGVTGVVLAKLDGTAKGGIALAIEDTLGLPIKLIGIGEGIDDIEPFDPKSYVDALLS
jgi:fused signal recognition particle receptor